MGLSRKFAIRLAGIPGGRITRWFVLAAWLVTVALAIPLAGKLSEVADDSATVELPQNADATRVARLADRFPDGTVALGIVVYARPGGLTEADRAKVEADRSTLAPLAADPIDPARVSADGEALALAVPLADDDSLSDNAARVRDRARGERPDGLTVRLTGPAGNALDASDGRERVAKMAMMVTALVVAVLLLVIYRSPVLWLLPLINVAVAFVLTDAVTYLLGRFAGLTVNPANAIVITVLVFGVGTDYALLLLARYREELRRTADRHAAMAVAVRRAAPTIVASAATVSLGLLCLIWADMGFNATLGPAGAIGVLSGLAVMLTLLPAQLAILGRWVFWPAIPRVLSGAGVDGDTGADHPMWSRIARLVAARPRAVWVASVLALGLLALGALGMRTGLDDAHIVLGTPDSVAGQRLLGDHFPAGTTRPVQVIADAPAASRVEAALRGVPGVVSVGPAVTATDGGLVRFDVVLADPTDSPAAVSTVDRVRTAVSVVPDAHALVGGRTATSAAVTEAQAHDRRVVIPLVLAAVLLILIVLLRALLAPVLLILTVVLSYFAALGASWLLVRHVMGFPAMDVQVMLVGFLFLVALGVDYNIFLVSRIRQEAAVHGHRAGVLRALTATGGVITSAGVVLAATFAVLLFTPFVAFIQIGLLVALGVLLDTVLVRSILVPALALDLGERFWWPARRVVHPEGVDLAPPDLVSLNRR